MPTQGQRGSQGVYTHQSEQYGPEGVPIEALDGDKGQDVHRLSTLAIAFARHSIAPRHRRHGYGLVATTAVSCAPAMAMASISMSAPGIPRLPHTVERAG